MGERIMDAIKAGDVEAVDRLATTETVNAASRDNMTPLMLAARLGHAAIVAKLLAVGAVVDASRVRVQFARDFLYDGSVSLMVSSPVGIFLVGAAPRPEGV